MAKKKSKEPMQNSNNSNSNSIFNALFGDAPEDATAASIFSDANPFRRKANDDSQTFLNKEDNQLGLGFEKAPIENPNKNGVVTGVDDDSAELKKKRRKKDKKANFNGELVGEESKRLRRDGEVEENVDSTEFSKKGKEKQRNLELNSEKMSKKDGKERASSEKMSKKRGGLESNWEDLSENEGNEKPEKVLKEEGKERPNLGLESKGLGEKGNGVSDDLGVKNEGSERKKKKKRKRDEIEVEYEKKLYGAVVEDENKDEGGVVVGEKRKKMDNPEDLMVSKEGFDDEDKLSRTVFVGNLPLKIKKKVLIKEFGKFGEVESVRIRSVPVGDTKLPRKGAIIKNKLNENADSVHAYIVFKTEDSAEASLAHNMAVVEGNHIRVDRACPPRKKLKGDTAALYDNKRTVFVGNLPFVVKDEEIYQLFTGMKDLGSSVEAVRVIRDHNTSLGKGIAYVLFKTTDAADMVVKKKNLKLRDRVLRLSRAKPNSTPSKSKISSPSGKDKFSSKKFGEYSRTPGSNDKIKEKATISYQGLRATKSGGSKKVHGRTSQPVNLNSRPQQAHQPTDHKRKRPAVAARKAKALKTTAAGLKQGGTKRKHENRTPDSSRQKKKARKNQ